MLSSYSHEELLFELQRRNSNSYSKVKHETPLELAQRRFLRGEEQITRLSLFIDNWKSKGFDTSVSERAMYVLQSSVNIFHRNLIEEQERMIQSHRLTSM